MNQVEEMYEPDMTPREYYASTKAASSSTGWRHDKECF